MKWANSLNILGILFLGIGAIYLSRSQSYQTRINDAQIKINDMQGDTTSKLIDRIEHLEKDHGEMVPVVRELKVRSDMNRHVSQVVGKALSGGECGDCWMFSKQWADEHPELWKKMPYTKD